MEDGEAAAAGGAAAADTTFAAYCLHRLLAVDAAPVEVRGDAEIERLSMANSKELLRLIRAKTTTELGPDGKLVVLASRPSIPLPRSRRLPEPRAPTRWEKFAREKGIAKQKRSRLVFDERSQDWVPRWGRGSKKHLHRKADEAIFELQPGEKLAEALENRRGADRLAKRKQQYRELRNKVEAAGGRISQADLGGKTAPEKAKKNRKVSVE